MSCMMSRECVQGEMKLQIDRMIAKFFSSLPVDEQLNFSVAVTVMSVQRKWRQRMKAHKARLQTHKLHQTAVIARENQAMSVTC